MKTSIVKWGNSAALRIPKHLLQQMTLRINDQVEIKLNGNQLIIEPSEPSLDDLLAGVSEDNKHHELICDTQGVELL